MSANLQNQSPLLKEVYEKRKPKVANQNVPPWMQGNKKKETETPAMAARKSVAQKRLAQLKSKGQGK